MHQIEQPLANRFPSLAGSMRSDLSHTADAHTGVQEQTTGAFSVRLLAAPEDDQDAAVLAVRGEIDLGTAPLLRKVLLPVLEHETGPVVVDLSEVAFMDSTGVHVLVDTLERLRLENRRLAVACREGGQVHRVLGLVGLLDKVAVHRSRESALIAGGDRLRSKPRGNLRRPEDGDLEAMRPHNLTLPSSARTREA